jgi:hypothetical protein
VLYLLFEDIQLPPKSRFGFDVEVVRLRRTQRGVSKKGESRRRGRRERRESAAFALIKHRVVSTKVLRKIWNNVESPAGNYSLGRSKRNE